MASPPHPIILCGQREEVGRVVIDQLKPEFEIIHMILTPEAGRVEIPLILSGNQSVPSTSTLGSRDYSRLPVAVLTGNGYNADDVATMMEACEGCDVKVPWLRPSQEKMRDAPPYGPAYGPYIAKRAKKVLMDVVEGRANGVGEVVFY